MKICGFFHGVLLNDKIVLKPNDGKDISVIRKLFSSKINREKRAQKEILLKCEIDAAFQQRSFKQLNAVWKLIEVIFESENGYKPVEEEKYELYLDLLELYADKIPNRYNRALRSIHISEANTLAAAHFIDGLMYHLSTMCSLTVDLQATVRNVLYEWEIWRGKQKKDFRDGMTDDEMRRTAVYSEASGIAGGVDLHHIVSRGAAPQFADCAWNLLALTREEHGFFHAHGWSVFLDKYPHLRGRVERAFEMAGHFPVRLD